jgi:hypothetical protein
VIRARCDACHKPVYIDAETYNKFNENSTDYPHSCAVKIPLYTDTVREKGREVKIPLSRFRDETIAAMITAKAIELGWNPYTVKTHREGDFVILSQ